MHIPTLIALLTTSILAVAAHPLNTLERRGEPPAYTMNPSTRPPVPPFSNPTCNGQGSLGEMTESSCGGWSVYYNAALEWHPKGHKEGCRYAKRTATDPTKGPCLFPYVPPIQVGRF
ncbi:hypothetical protein Hypma_013986 [Hypsizygus marmoreus]|uniref:Uncharacterized protein n=1 Tax=Hypsizygus marmoreus TaxID=39966 RepID=A0A369KB96_HYPMA|nr:hypothetical protein Hypma_013986 [Hypsizygus marmoreus]